jgi:hypothetical protein
MATGKFGSQQEVVNCPMRDAEEQSDECGNGYPGWDG